MCITLEDYIDNIKQARKFFLKHLEGLHDEQWDWKPNSECKSIKETIRHLIIGDRAYLQILQTGKVPEFDNLDEDERNINNLIAILAKSHDELTTYIRVRFVDTPLDTEIPFFDSNKKLGIALAGMTSEDYYHAGQAAYIRIATDPSWDYYASIYGDAEA